MANAVTHFEIHGRDGKKAQDFGVAQAIGEPMVTVYVDVEDLDATLETAESLGGKTILPPSDVPGGPRLAQFADPDGNVIGLTQVGTM